MVFEQKGKGRAGGGAMLQEEGRNIPWAAVQKTLTRGTGVEPIIWKKIG